MAHVTALAAARHAVLEAHGWDVECDGLFGAPPVTVIVGAEAHATLFKALNLVGLGGGRARVVPADSQGRLDAAAIPRTSGPVIICAQAGNVNTGVFDPLLAIVDRARELGAWVHVDGAFGLWARAAAPLASLLDGIESVDSCAADAHKWLNVPYDNGVVLVRKERLASLRAAMAIHGAYLPDEDPRDAGRFAPESSRRARGVDVWAALLSLGRRGLADLIERDCRLARRFAAGLRDAGHEVLNDVVLNQVLVSFGDDRRTRAVIEAVQADGTCWVGGTSWHGRAAMRISVSCWATTDAAVDESLAAISRISRRPNGITPPSG
jgi:glutamate/tyrosine decarboxylase-like PLP-dependent enzyme